MPPPDHDRRLDHKRRSQLVLTCITSLNILSPIPPVAVIAPVTAPQRPLLCQLAKISTSKQLPLVVTRAVTHTVPLSSLHPEQGGQRINRYYCNILHFYQGSHLSL